MATTTQRNLFTAFDYWFIGLAAYMVESGIQDYTHGSSYGEIKLAVGLAFLYSKKKELAGTKYLPPVQTAISFSVGTFIGAALTYPQPPDEKSLNDGLAIVKYTNLVAAAKLGASAVTFMRNELSAYKNTKEVDKIFRESGLKITYVKHLKEMETEDRQTFYISAELAENPDSSHSFESCVVAVGEKLANAFNRPQRILLKDKAFLIEIETASPLAQVLDFKEYMLNKTARKR